MMKVELTVTQDGDGADKIAQTISMNTVYDDFITWMDIMEDLRKTLGASFGYELKEDADTK
jgi:hypothetical protein